MIYSMRQCLFGLLDAIDADSNHIHFCSQWLEQNDVSSLDDVLTLLERLAIPFQVVGSNTSIAKQEHIAVLEIDNDNASVGRYSLGGYLRYDGEHFVEDLAPRSGLESVFIVISGFPEEKHAPDWLASQLTHYRPLLPKLLLISLFANVFALMIPFVTMSVYDHVIAGDAGHEALGIGIGALLLFVMLLSLRILRSQLLSTISNKVSREVSEALVHKILATPLVQSRQSTSSGLMSRLVNAENLKGIVQGPLGGALFDLPFVLLFIVAIGALGGWIVVVPIVSLVTYFLLASHAQKRVNQKSYRNSVAGTTRSSLLMELNTKLMFLRSTGYLEHWLKRFQKANQLAAKNSFDHVSYQAKYTSIYYAIGLLSTLSVIALGIDLIFNQVMTAGGLIASMMLISRVTGPAQMLANSASRYKQVLDTKTQVNTSLRQTVGAEFSYQHHPLSHTAPSVALDQVTLRYASQKKPALSGISISVEPGQLVVVTGSMGSGKTSLLESIAAMTPVQSGTITIDGSTLSQFDPQLLRQWFSYLPARRVLPVLTIKEFVSNGKASDDIDVVRSIAEAGGKLWLDSLPEGIDTQLMTLVNSDVTGEVADMLYLAKFKLHPSPLCIMDNPSGALIDWIESIRGSATIVLSSFDKSLIKKADQVVVLDNGNLVYAGPPVSDDEPSAINADGAGEDAND